MNAKILKRDRPTIGILAGLSTLEGSTPDYYRVSVIQGIQSAARNRGCNLLLSWGIRRITDIHQIYTSWPVVSNESDFIPVGPWNTDGLIVFTPLADEKRSRYLQRLQADGYPVLFIGTGEQGPQISVDSGTGIHQAIAHLTEHGHRHIAFLAGSQTDKGDSEIRLNAYHAAVTEFQLETDPRLVAWGWHDYSMGYKALQSILASGVKFTALLASNDNSAIGAMRAIHDAGLKVPGDIAVIGFDDQPEALAQVPPLSSVHVPLHLMGEQALIMMAHHLMQQTPLSPIQIPTRIIRRQSCGCMPDVVSSALNSVSQAKLQNQEGATLEERQKHLVNEMLNTLPASLRFPGGDEISRICTMLVDAFCRSIHQLTPTYFRTALMDCMTQLEKDDKNLEPWQEMVSVLRREMIVFPALADVRKQHLAEDLLHQFRTALGESAQRRDERHQYWRTRNAVALNALTASLSAVLNEHQVDEVLNKHLASVGIRHAKIIFFQADGDDLVGRSVLLNTEDGHSFLSRQFPPAGLYAPGELLNLVLLPLVFQQEALGYVAFDSTTDLGACAVIATQLAATIKVARLHAQVVALSLTDVLTGLHNRRYFELFLENEVNRSQRFLRSLGVILVDCDNFKEYNDSYGHPAGDELLQQVAQCLLLDRHTADTVARIGGDEFVVVLPETELGGVLDVGKKIQSAVMQLTTLKRRISVSIGLVSFHNESLSADALVQQADIALYESKRKGKNRISFFCGGRTFDEKEISSLL